MTSAHTRLLLPATDPLRSMMDMIHYELTRVYGDGIVACVNPVWDQSVLDGLVSEYEQVCVGGGSKGWL